MPAAKTFYSARDIMLILGVGKNTAYEILHAFEVRGQLFRHGQEAKPPIKTVFRASRA